MYLVTKIFDDAYIEITNLQDGTRNVLSVQEQKKWCDEKEVYGFTLTQGNNCAVVAYDFIRFSTEIEAYEYCNERRINVNNIVFTNDSWYIFNRTYKIWHVSYYVYTQVGDEVTFIGHKNSYTPYKQAAKEFTKEDAYTKAKAMTKKSKTGKYWYVLREFNMFQ